MNSSQAASKVADKHVVPEEPAPETAPDREGFFDRGGAALRRVWRDWTRGTKSALSELNPDLPEHEHDLVRAQIDACLAGQGGQVSARARAAELGRAYVALSDLGKERFLTLLATHYKPDWAKLRTAAAGLQMADPEGDCSAERAQLLDAMRSPRIELLKQFNSLEEGVKFLVDLRADLMGVIRRQQDPIPDLSMLNAELHELLASWFDVGFLELRRITWDASAALLEKLVQYEAVHEIRSWVDLQKRLESDRRCYAFFHPAMPDEPLIFVEVALVDGIADNVQDLLKVSRDVGDPENVDAAIFYSISNAQAGLAGVPFGDFLIKQVVHELTSEFPKLKTLATLSPIPRFKRWLNDQLSGDEEVVKPGEVAAVQKIDDRWKPADLMRVFEERAWLDDEDLAAALQPVLLRLCARYLTSVSVNGEGIPRVIDPVGHFHLSNGASVDRLNWCADRSLKGLAQSAGMMVNYVYKRAQMENNHEAYRGRGKVKFSNQIKTLL